MNTFWEAVGALLPPAGAAVMFVVAIRAVVHADRRERAAQAQAERQQEMAHPDAVGAPDNADREIPTN